MNSKSGTPPTSSRDTSLRHYRKIFTGLIFFRYISAAFEKRYNELVAEGEGFKNETDEHTQENVFFVPHNL